VYAAHIKKLTPKKITICYDNDKSEEHIKIELFLLRVVINGEWAEAPEKWAQCSQCSKWRKLPPGVNPASLPTVWTCSMNGAGMINECDDAEEFSGPDVDLPFKGPLAAVYEARRTICKAIAENSAGAYSYMEDIPALVNASAVGEKRFRPWKQGKFSLMANGRDVATTLPTLRDYIKGNADILRTLGENEAHKKALQTILTYTSKRGRKRKAGVVAKSSLGSAVGGAGSGGGGQGAGGARMPRSGDDMNRSSIHGRRVKQRSSRRQPALGCDGKPMVVPRETSQCEFVCQQCGQNEDYCRGYGCYVCKLNDDEEHILICDACQKECHYYCATPPLDGIPEGEWFCMRPKCSRHE
jgi:hypothetical protein